MFDMDFESFSLSLGNSNMMFCIYENPSGTFLNLSFPCLSSPIFSSRKCCSIVRSDVLRLSLGIPASSRASFSAAVLSDRAFAASPKLFATPWTHAMTAVMSAGAVTVAVPVTVIVLSMAALTRSEGKTMSVRRRKCGLRRMKTGFDGTGAPPVWLCSDLLTVQEPS